MYGQYSSISIITHFQNKGTNAVAGANPFNNDTLWVHTSTL